VTVFPFIAAEKDAGSPVAVACSTLEVSRSAFYAWLSHEPSAHALRDEHLSSRISAIFVESRGTYGAPRIQRSLRQEGERCSRRRVARLMATLKLSGRLKRAFRHTTISDPSAHLAMDDRLQRAFQPQLFALDQAWVGDITYLRCKEGWAYLATVIDLASRRVVGWSLANHLQASLVESAFSRAVHSRRPPAGLIFHSDRGTQYTSVSFQKALAQAGAVSSFSRPAECWDNAVAESFFATLKRELTDRRTWPDVEELRRALVLYIDGFYNTRRLHSALDYHSPADYERLIINAAPAA
jgi:transposase InsO family protein